MLSKEEILENETRERDAFDDLASATQAENLVTSDWTFDRYRSASNQAPLFNSYPDLLFAEIGREFRETVQSSIARPLEGLSVLDLGAGDGAWSVILAEQGAELSSIEISPKQVELAKARMANHHLSWKALVGSAFRLNDEFEESSFDLVFGPAVLHHLTADLPAVFHGVHTVLRTGGIAVFTEPFMGVQWLRSLRLRLSGVFPLDAESPDERPLELEDIRPLLETFSDVRIVYRDLFEKAFRRFGAPRDVKQVAVSIDRKLLQFRMFERLATSVVLTARK